MVHDGSLVHAIKMEYNRSGLPSIGENQLESTQNTYYLRCPMSHFTASIVTSTAKYEKYESHVSSISLTSKSSHTHTKKHKDSNQAQSTWVSAIQTSKPASPSPLWSPGPVSVNLTMESDVKLNGMNKQCKTMLEITLLEHLGLVSLSRLNLYETFSQKPYYPSTQLWRWKHLHDKNCNIFHSPEPLQSLGLTCQRELVSLDPKSNQPGAACWEISAEKENPLLVSYLSLLQPLHKAEIQIDVNLWHIYSF